MNQQEFGIAVWRKMFQDMANANHANIVELNLQRERADALQAELDKIKQANEAKSTSPILAAVENDAA